MMKPHHLKFFLEKVLSLLFSILIFSHLSWKFSEIAIISPETVLMNYLRNSVIIFIDTIFAQNLILLFQLGLLSIMVNILYIIEVSLIWNMKADYVEVFESFWHMQKQNQKIEAHQLPMLFLHYIHCMKNNIFVKTLNVNISFSGFSGIDGNIIFSVKRELKKILYFL